MGNTQMRSLLLLSAAALLASVNANAMWQYHGPNPDVDPLNKHCFDITANTSDAHAKEWLSANEWQYIGHGRTSYNWTAGLCDSNIFPVVELVTHPGVTTQVTERKLGHALVDTLMMTTVGTKDCRASSSNKPLSINFTNAAGVPAKIRGCLNQYACKPYLDCELKLADGATETITFDDTFKYFVFTFYGKITGGEGELYPDANLKYPPTYTIKAPKAMEGEAHLSNDLVLPFEDTFVVYTTTPGNHAHCTQMAFGCTKNAKGATVCGKNNPYYLEHGYQYQPPTWTVGACPNPPYNWFNKNTTIAPGVLQTLMGSHTTHK